MGSSAIDLAILNYLAADAALRGLLPDGVYLNAAPAAAKRFVKIAKTESVDLDVFGGRAQENVLFSVIGIGLSTVLNNQKSMEAEDRIDALLADPAPFAVAGYTFCCCYRDEPGRIDFEEESDADPTVRWIHRGAHYRLTVTKG